jgi:hypothetical protein
MTGDRFLIIFVRQSRVPHISLVFREMWDTTGLDPQRPASTRLRFVEPHISRKTSEIWGTRVLSQRHSCKRTSTLPGIQQLAEINERPRVIAGVIGSQQHFAQ